MKRIIRPFVVLFSVMLLTVSCLGDDNYSDVVYYGDTAITSFSLGTLKRTMVTEASDGTDSSYVADVDCSSYDFYIDQLQKEIYNPDSLPAGTDAAHVICNVTSKNSGVVLIAYKNSEGEDSLAFFSSSDSIDFTEPREFRVYSNDGSAYRAYNVKVNVHKEYPDSINWHDMGDNQAFTAMSGMKAVAFGGKLLVFGTSQSGTSVYSTSTDGSLAWRELDTNMALDADAYKSAVAKDGYVYTLSGGDVLRSADGETWETMGAAALRQLIAASKQNLYAFASDGRVVMSEDDGAIWAADNVVGDLSMMPADNVSYGSMALATDASSERIIVAGNPDLDNSEYAEDSVAVVWGKIDEYSEGSRRHSWTNFSEDNGYRLPRLSDLCVVVYGGKLVALGGRGLGTSSAEAFSNFYISEDSGITWHTNGELYLPENFTNGDKDVFSMVADEDNYLWIICGGTGKVWRGRLNKLAWENAQTSFTE